MRSFLSEFIDTLSTGARERVGNLLNDSRVSKEQMVGLATQLSQSANLAGDVSTEIVNSLDPVSSSNVHLSLQSLMQYIGELFEVANLTTGVLSNQNAILSNEITRMMIELNDLEKLADNYGFLLSDGGAYSTAYLESFSDNLNRDSFSFLIPDRASQIFTSSEEAIVDSFEGVLTLVPENEVNAYSFSASIVAANAGSSLVDDVAAPEMRKLNNITSSDLFNGWRYAARTRAPLVTSIPGSPSSGGLQLCLEFTLPQSAPISQLALYATDAMEVLRLVAYHDIDDTDGVDLISNPIKLEGQKTTIHFPMRMAVKLRVWIAQRTYLRALDSFPPDYESQHADLWNRIAERYRSDHPSRFPEFYEQMLALKRENELRNSHRVAAPPRVPARWNHRSVVRPTLQGVRSRSLGDFGGSTNAQNMLMQHLPTFAPSAVGLISGTKINPYKTGVDFINGIDPNLFEANAHNELTQIYRLPRYVQDDKIASTYVYKMSLSRVLLWADTAGAKGVFVSKPFGSGEQIEVVRIKTAETQFQISNPAEGESDTATSVEYSVTNRVRPSDETFWIPILPVDTTDIKAERLFPGADGVCILRFPAVREGTIIVYKNRQRLDLSVINFLLFAADNSSVVGVRIPPSMFSATDYLTVDYKPAGDPTVVSLGQVPLVSAHDYTGSGESFISTSLSNSVELSASPYVDTVQVATSKYTSLYGLTPYQPITVVLDDGSVAVNLTDYTSTENLITLPNEDAQKYYYLHSGNFLIFNKPITSTFRVYYQYMENNVRVRVVLRSNQKEFVSPKVDFYHLKAKTRRPDISRTI